MIHTHFKPQVYTADACGLPIGVDQTDFEPAQCRRRCTEIVHRDPGHVVLVEVARADVIVAAAARVQDREGAVRVLVVADDRAVDPFDAHCQPILVAVLVAHLDAPLSPVVDRVADEFDPIHTFDADVEFCVELRYCVDLVDAR